VAEYVVPMPGSRTFAAIARGFLITAAILFSAWAGAALYFDVRFTWVQIPSACLLVVVSVAIVWRTHAKPVGLLLWLGVPGLVLAWWLSLRPTNMRTWQPDVAELPWVEMNSDSVTIHNVRNFDYRAETDFTQRWEIRTVNLAEIRGTDLFLTHFGSPLIAHAIVSFQIRDAAGKETFIAMSIEQRRAVGQAYSTLRGFFRQYELIYLVADERDVVRLRTDYRTGEDVRLYHTLTTSTDSRRLFLQYLQWIDNIRREPEWYNALSANCTTSVTSYLAKNHIGGLSRWDWRSVLNGLGDRMLYDDGDLATGGLPFEDLAKQALINDKAKALGNDPTFSRDIRQGHPGFD
jgi:hypothetical protein